MNVFRDIQNYQGKKVRLCTPFSPVKPTTIYIYKVLPDEQKPNDKAYDLVIFRYWTGNHYKYDINNRTVLDMYNRNYKYDKSLNRI